MDGPNRHRLSTWGRAAKHERGSFGPVYEQIDIWEHLGDGHYGIKD